MEKGKMHLAKEDLLVEKEWQSDGIPVLQARVCLPQCAGKGRRARRFNRYYQAYARAYLHYCEKELLPRAAAQMRGAVEQSRLWQVASARLDYTVTLEREDILSLYTDAREEGLSFPRQLRRADNWSTDDGLQLPLETFFPLSCPVKRRLLAAARQRILAQIESGGSFYPRWRFALRRCYSSRRFYLTPEGLVWFYPQCTLSPAQRGSVLFFLPYDAQGPFLPPMP